MAWPWQAEPGDADTSLRSEVALAIRQVMGRTTADDGPPIEPGSFLGADLGLSSVAVARLAGILQKRHGREPLPFHTLFVGPDGAPLQDIRVADLVSFLRQRRRGSQT
jgi:hypothetical protein